MGDSYCASGHESPNDCAHEDVDLPDVGLSDNVLDTVLRYNTRKRAENTIRIGTHCVAVIFSFASSCKTRNGSTSLELSVQSVAQGVRHPVDGKRPPILGGCSGPSDPGAPPDRAPIGIKVMQIKGDADRRCSDVLSGITAGSTKEKYSNIRAHDNNINPSGYRSADATACSPSLR